MGNLFRIIGDQTGEVYVTGCFPDLEEPALDAAIDRVRKIFAISGKLAAGDILCVEYYDGRDENDMPVWRPR